MFLLESVRNTDGVCHVLCTERSTQDIEGMSVHEVSVQAVLPVGCCPVGLCASCFERLGKDTIIPLYF